MVRTLKILIDIFFGILCLGILGFIFILPFEIFSTKIASVEIKTSEELHSLPFLYWSGIALSIITYLFFLIGLHYLRKTANHFTRNSFFHISIIWNLKRSGIFFIISGVVLALAYLAIWALDSKSDLRLVLGANVMIPLFLCIVGLFFILQSKILDQARLLKQDNELTI